MPLGTEVGLGPGHIVLDGDPVTPAKGHAPQFSAHVCCSQTAGWIKMPLGTQVGLGSGDIVLDGDPAPSNKEHSTPHSSAHVYSGQTDVLDGTQLPPLGKRHSSPCLFGPYLLWPNGRPSQLLLSLVNFIVTGQSQSGTMNKWKYSRNYARQKRGYCRLQITSSKLYYTVSIIAIADE